MNQLVKPWLMCFLVAPLGTCSLDIEFCLKIKRGKLHKKALLRPVSCEIVLIHSTSETILHNHILG